MVFESLLAKEVVKKIPWKLVAIGLVTILMTAGAWFAVRSYNTAITTAEKAQKQTVELSSKLDQANNDIKTLQANMGEVRAFYSARERRQQKASNRRMEVLSRKEKTDESGAIAFDDPTLLELNSLFPPDAGGNSAAYASDPSRMPTNVVGNIRPGG